MADGYEAWRREVNDYQEKKQNFQHVPEPYVKVTNAHVKRQEVEYNPITQTFTDPKKENMVKGIEQLNTVETLAQNKVRTSEYNP